MESQIKSYYLRVLPAMSDEAWNWLYSRMTVLELKKGEVWLKPGQVSQHVGFIEKGLIRLFYTQDGKDFVQAIMSEGTYMGEYASFLTRKETLQCLDALEDSTLILLSYSVMQEAYQRYPIFERFGRYVAEELFIELYDRISTLLTQPPEIRYSKLREENPELFERVPQYMLASLIGVSPEHLSRIRAKKAKP